MMNNRYLMELFVSCSLYLFQKYCGIDIERKNRVLKVCYVPTTSATFLAFFLVVPINNTNETNKAGSMCH